MAVIECGISLKGVEGSRHCGSLPLHATHQNLPKGSRRNVNIPTNPASNPAPQSMNLPKGSRRTETQKHTQRSRDPRGGISLKGVEGFHNTIGFSVPQPHYLTVNLPKGSRRHPQPVTGRSSPQPSNLPKGSRRKTHLWTQHQKQRQRRESH